jgi:hypothetical protein
MSEADDNDWSDYETGPFCRHWGDPSDCDRECKRCGHKCPRHGFGNDNSACMEEGCQCQSWAETEGDAGWREWGSPDWPDWQDLGKFAEFKMEDGEVVRGKLEYEDMTSGPDESPLIFICRPDGTRASMVDADFWRFVEPPALSRPT